MKYLSENSFAPRSIFGPPSPPRTGSLKSGFSVHKFGNYVVEYNFNYRPTPKLSEGDGLQHSPLKRGMPDDALTGVENAKAAGCALKYINPINFDGQR